MKTLLKGAAKGLCQQNEKKKEPVKDNTGLGVASVSISSCEEEANKGWECDRACRVTTSPA